MCLAVWATPLLSGVVLGTVVALFGILRYMCGTHTPLSDVTLLNWYIGVLRYHHLQIVLMFGQLRASSLVVGPRPTSPFGPLEDHLPGYL